MKITRPSAVAATLMLATIAALSFLYGMPTGRLVRSETLRAFRLARNATGIHPTPVLTVKTWNAIRGVLLVEVYDSGRVLVSGRGERIEQQLTPGATEAILRNGKVALGDFNSSNCGTTHGGVNAELYLLIEGKWLGSVCRDASDWPRGVETKRLLHEIASHVAGLSERF